MVSCFSQETKIKKSKSAVVRSMIENCDLSNDEAHYPHLS